MPKRKIAILWNTLTGYTNAALKPLSTVPDVEIFVADQVGEGKQAPFADEMFSWIPASRRYRYSSTPDAAELLPMLEDFQPDTMLVASWNSPGYRAICRAFTGRAVRICAMDNPWESRLKQWVGVLTAPIYVQRLFDVAFVAGERQAEFARRMGFSHERLWQGFLVPDYTAFERAFHERPVTFPKTFLYAGRLSPEKGIAMLADAYRQYRQSAPDPWPLHVIGTGAQASLLADIPGVTLHGFVQPDDVPIFFSRAGCLVLPSSWEPWGVVLQESAVAGLPMISTWKAGASVHYIKDGFNGLLIDAGNTNGLLNAMKRISGLPENRLKNMSEASRALGQQAAPEVWVSVLLERSAHLLPKLAPRR